MSNTGYHWTAWTTLVTGQAINHGGDNTSAEVDLADKSACEISVAAVYSDHAITAGAINYVLGEIESGGPTFESEDDGPWCAGEMAHAQNGTRRTRFAVNPAQVGKFKILTTYDGGASSTATVTVRYRTATLQTA
jgi:hypothetical protein